MLDKTIGAASSLFNAIPEIVIAIALLAIAVRWRILPVGGMSSGDHEGLSEWSHVQDIAGRMLLPILILTLAESAIIVRHVRASVLEALGAPFVQAAHGLGINPHTLAVPPRAASRRQPGDLTFRISRWPAWSAARCWSK